ncbi:MAG: carotenoid biosynthesis protein [Flavobacteriales bacterium]|nr:carotenoid biosynthesis protein [Flavobacteriales bacterium]
MSATESFLQEIKERLYHFTWSPSRVMAYITIIYIVGLIGLSLPITRPLFVFLVPFNILMSVGLLLLFHSPWNWQFVAVMAGIGVAGFFAEYLGVQTGLLFGSYHYKGGLGTKWLSIPLILAPNWMYMIYTTGYIAQRFFSNYVVRIIVGAMLMVVYDLFLEPSAMEYHFWQWETGYVPLQNYVGWLGISLLFQAVFQWFVPSLYNKIAIGIYIIQFLFFVSLFVINILKSIAF